MALRVDRAPDALRLVRAQRPARAARASWVPPCAVLLTCSLTAACSGSRELELLTHELDAAITASGDAGVVIDAGASSCEDEDQDGFGRNCPAGRDCDDADPTHARGHEAYVDLDEDGWGSTPRYLCVEDGGTLPPGYALSFGDCLDQVFDVHPGVEIDGCDGIDSDCDTLVDEDQVPQEVLCGQGVCARTALTSCAEADPLSACVPGAPLTPDDALCDGTDDDCDGRVDEDYVAPPSTCQTDECESEGVIACVQGTLSDTCEPPVPSSTDETCDGKDDDCDGEFDEDFASQSTACGDGACASGGETSCDEGELKDSCTPGSAGSSDASCDNRDDDCDGEVDEDFVETTTQCGQGACASTGTRSCSHGTVTNSCTPGVPAASDTTCDAIDDDCNGQTDEDYVGQAQSCGVGACGRSGTSQCVQGVVQVSCTPGAPAANDATCNGIDDDCNGQRDEDHVPQTVSCGVGACTRDGTRSCVNGSLVTVCTPGAAGANDASCNGDDNDCDGKTDEHYTVTTTACGQGACSAQGTLSCVNGAPVNSCNEGQAGGLDSTCDGVDSDCDGNVDDDYVPQQISCGVGVCRRTVTTSCVNGNVLGCTPGPTTGDDSDCDNVDDDCDGLADDGYVGTSTSCGVGACASTGVTSCVNGSVRNSCQAGTPAANDATCNNIDEDCNGTRDEDYSVSINCGVGECVRAGLQSCSNGVLSNACTPGQPTSDATCNGDDEDCDGEADEHYPRPAISCGLGVCTRSGNRECVNGTTVNVCTPGQPTLTSDTTCNQLDEDCDGLLNDNYASVSTSCGVGYCRTTGVTSCANGSVQDSCDPRDPLADRDTSCDGVDDDCDGKVDDEYTATATSCGVGACRAAGSVVCQQGVPIDTCKAGTPASTDSKCDNLDEDCDSRFDEDFKGGDVDCSVGQCAARGEWVCKEGQTLSTCVTPDNSCEPYGKDVCEGDQFADSWRPCTGEFCWTTSVCDVSKGSCVQGNLCGVNECGSQCCVKESCGALRVCAAGGKQSCAADCSGQLCGDCTDCANGCNTKTGRCNLIVIGF